MKRLLLTVLVVIASVSASFALPRFALKKGEITCSGCHLDPSGGGLRTAGGEGFEIRGLPMWKVSDSLNFSGQLTSSIKLGADFRSQFLGFDQTYPSYSGDSANVSSKDTTISVNGFHAMTYALELGIQATHSLAGYLRYDLLPSVPMQSFAILHYVHESGELLAASDAVNDAYIKFGAFTPTFGIRFDDHTLYVRGGTAGLSGFDQAGFFWQPGYRDVGVELGGYFFDHLSLQAGIYNGADDGFIGRTYINSQNPNLALTARLNLSGELIEDVLAGEIGASYYSHPKTDNKGTNIDLSVFSIHGGINVGPVAILAEYDKGENISTGISTPSRGDASALTLEGSVLVTKGLSAILRFETFKNEKDSLVVIDVKNRLTFGCQWFPVNFIEIRPEFRIATVDVPYTGPDVAGGATPSTEEHTQGMCIIQLHFFF